MNFNQNPFSLYDFLGYFIPGALLIYMLSCIDWTGSSMSFIHTIEFKLRNDNYLPFIIAAYVIGHFLSFFSSITIEKFSIWLYGYPSKYLLKITHDGYLYKGLPFTKILKRCIIGLLLFPIAFYDVFLDRILKLRILHGRTLDQSIINLIVQHAKRAFNKIDIEQSQGQIDIKNEDFFTMLYHYVLERNKNHAGKIQNYVALYGFLRSITLIFVLLFWVLLIMKSYISLNQLPYVVLLISISFVSYIFFLSFKKFYRRYSQETLFALTTMEH